MHRLLVLVLPLALAACAGRTRAPRPAVKDAAAVGPAGPASPALSAGPGETLAEYDLNHDGKPDVWKVTRRAADGKELLARRERDLNDDGKIDVWEAYDDDGNVVKQTVDLDFDGKPDLVLHFEKGQLARKELGFAFDGKPHAWSYYEKGKLARKERDENNDGRVDYWEYWEGGEVDRIGVDLDADGRVDRWEQRKPQTAEVKPKP